MRILNLFQNKQLEEFCQGALSDYNVEAFENEHFQDSDLVLTDSGIRSGKIPGFVPVLLVISDEKPHPDAYYTRVVDEDLPEDHLREEVEHSSGQASIGRDMGLAEVQILNSEKLNELVQLGGDRVVREGLRNFIKSTTLQLNECRSMLERNSYDDIRFVMHRLKGNAATLGGEQLNRLFSEMEESLLSENYSNFDEKLKLAYTLLAAFSYLSNGWYSE